MPSATMTRAQIDQVTRKGLSKEAEENLHFSDLAPAHLLSSVPFCTAFTIPVCSSSNMPQYFTSPCLYTCYCVLCLQIPPPSPSLPHFLSPLETILLYSFPKLCPKCWTPIRRSCFCPIHTLQPMHIPHCT